MKMLFALIMAVSLCGSIHAEEAVQVGVLRWDNWYSGNFMTPALNNSSFPERVPYYAYVDKAGHVSVSGEMDNVVKADIAYAYSAGIDYFIFGYYSESGSWGRDPSTMRKLNRALRTFLNVDDKRSIKFAVSLNQSSPDSDLPSLIAAFSSFVSDPAYERTQTNNAPIFVYGADPKRWISDKGSPEKVRSFFAQLRKGIYDKTGISTTLILMASNPDEASEYAAQFGLDMSTTYAHTAGHDQSSGREIDAATCVSIAQNETERALKASNAVIPNVTLGWDFRPAVQSKGASATDLDNRANWCAPLSQQQISQAVSYAYKVAAARGSEIGFRSLIFYAWNEFAEGGFMSPTLARGIHTLLAVREALGRKRSLPEVTLSWPTNDEKCAVTTDPEPSNLSGCWSDPRASVGWPCPPSTQAKYDEIRAPGGFESQYFSGAWIERRCEVSKP